MLAKKNKIKVPAGIAHINATRNNTMITITDRIGNIIVWSSSGSVGFKGTKKKTTFAAQLATESIIEKATSRGLETLQILAKGPGFGREIAIQILQNSGLQITKIKEITSLPHNGCRPPKKRKL